MSALSAETSEPDPVASAPRKDQAVDEKSDMPSGPDEIQAEDESKAEANKIAGIKEEEVAEKNEIATESKKNSNGETSRPRADEDGVLKTSAKIRDKRDNHSKYDPSVLPSTNDHSKIRAQVCSNRTFAFSHFTNYSTKGRILLRRLQLAN